MSPAHAIGAPSFGSFSQRDFYLAEFRGRSLGIAVGHADSSAMGQLENVLGDFAANATRVLLLSHDAALLAKLVDGRVVDPRSPRWVGEVWHALAQGGPHVGIQVAGPEALSAVARDVALRLRLAKLVWIDERGGLERADGGRLSYVALGELDALIAGKGAGLDSDRLALLREIRGMVEGGLPAAAICSLAGLHDELFTFVGSGTFFTRERYVEVRGLGLDDFDTAHELLRLGVAEGYLVERSDAEVELVLTNGFGVFVEGRYLAGIGALLPHREDRAAEIASLYTLTRFLGEGVGSNLVRHALERAAADGFDYAFACTTSERVEHFFRGQGFRRVDLDQVPASKWRGYSPERRERVRCLRRDTL